MDDHLQAQRVAAAAALSNSESAATDAQPTQSDSRRDSGGDTVFSEDREIRTDRFLTDFTLHDTQLLAVPEYRANRLRSSSFPSVFRGDVFGRVAPPTVDPFASWDDSALSNKYHVVLPVDDDAILEQDIEKLKVAVRRSEATAAGVAAASEDPEEQSNYRDSSTRSSSPGESRGVSDSDSGLDWREEAHTPEARANNSPLALPLRSRGGKIVSGRFQQPVGYFRELHELGCEIYESSLFPRYIDGTRHRPFEGRIIFEVGFLQGASIELTKWPEILAFCSDLTNKANEDGTVPHASLGRPHLVAYGKHDRVLTQFTQLVECRNIISRVWENIKIMKQANYCNDFISLLVLDRKRQNVATLARINCTTIENLTMDFENCLYQAVCDNPESVLAGSVDSYGRHLSVACGQLLTDLGLEPREHTAIEDAIEDIWRCAVHLLDLAVVSYAATHTQGLGRDDVTAVVLPGAFLETQYYIFRRRKFSCLDDFLGGQEAWVLEDFSNWLSQIPSYFPDLVQAREPPPLYLSTDAVTFGDIWGPMWKSHMVGNEVELIRYNVGGGAIIPWSLPSFNEVQVNKGEIFCHWVANNVAHGNRSGEDSIRFHESDLLLIGAPVQLRTNGSCTVSSVEVREQLRNSGSISQLGTARARWEQETRIAVAAITPPQANFGYQQGWKLREGRYMSASFVENWINHPESRSVRSLELRLGLEVSTCTYNARRVPLIDIFRTTTLINHLRSTSLKWQSKEQKAAFFRALLLGDYKAFGDLYESRPKWQHELGNAISCGLYMLQYTGKTKDDELQLFWAPESTQPGVCVTLRANDISWIGFLEETLTSGVMAVLGDRCLELPPLTKASRDIFEPFQNNPLLQTAIHLNDDCVPRSLQGRKRENRDPKSEYKSYWSMKYIEKGDKFSLGPRGRLETIGSIGSGPHKDQILAEWCPPNGSMDTIRGIPHALRQTAHGFPVLGKLINRPSPPLQHHEVGQDSIDRESDTEPVHFHIVSATSRKVPHSHTWCPPQRAYIHTRSYAFVNGIDGTPRSMIDNPTQEPPDTPRSDCRKKSVTKEDLKEKKLDEQ